MNPREREETIKSRIAEAVQEHPTLPNSRSPMRLTFREKMGPLKTIVEFCESCWVELYMLDKPIWYQSVGDQGLIDNICSWPTYNRWKRKARNVGELQALVSRDSESCACVDAMFTITSLPPTPPPAGANQPGSWPQSQSSRCALLIDSARQGGLRQNGAQRRHAPRL